MCNRFSRVTTVLLTLLLTACGIDQGGITGGDENPVPTKTVIIHGPKMGDIGSLSVNGIAIDVTNADFVVDGEVGSESDLRDGQLIEVIGTQTDGVVSVEAVSISYDENLRGPLGDIDAVNNEFMILNQLVRTNLSTAFDLGGQTLTDLLPNTSLEVSGYLNPDGVIIATFVGLPSAANSVEIASMVTSLDQVTSLLDAGGQLVDFSQAMLLAVPNGLLEIGFLLEIEGNLDPATGAIVATSIRFLSALPGVFNVSTFEDALSLSATAPRGVNVNNFITGASLPATFTLGEVEVSLDASTTIVGGTQSDLQIGTLVRVVGDVNPLDVIDAVQITIL